MSHITVQQLEFLIQKARNNPEMYLKDNEGSTYLYVETGRYKPYMPMTVKAIEKRGYKVVKKSQSVYYVYI